MRRLAREYIGLNIGRGGVSATLLARHERGYRLLELREAPYAERAPDGQAPGVEILAAALEGLDLRAGPNRPLQVALPDPLFSLAVFGFSELPRSTKQRMDLLRWRFSKELSLEPDAHTFSWQLLPGESAGHRMLALAVRADWLAVAKAALKRTQLVPEVIDASICHQINLLQQITEASGEELALVVVERETWSVLLLDGLGQPAFLRSRWRSESGNCGIELALIAAEVERAIRTFVHKDAGRSITRLCISANEGEGAQLASVLDERMPMRCEHLDPAERVSCESGGVTPALLAAGVPR